MQLIGSFVVRHTKIIIAVFLVLMFLGGIMALGVHVNLDNIGYLPDTSSAKRAVSMLQDEYGMRGTATLMIHEADPVKVMLLKTKLEGLDEINKVVWLDDRVDLNTPVAAWDTRLTDRFYKGGYALFTLLFSDKNDSSITHGGVRKVAELAGPDAVMAGPAITSQHSVERINREVPVYSAVAVVLILILLLLSTTSWLEPLLFLISIGAAIVINMGLNLLSGEVSQITFAAASILQLAVSMDYSIFMMHRFHERRAVGDDIKTAMVTAMKLSAAPVLASALTTVAGFAALMFMNFGIGGDLGKVLARGVLLSLLSVLTFLPALVIVTDKWVEKLSHRELSLPFKGVAKAAVRGRHVLALLLVLLAFLFFRAQGKVDYYYGMDNVLPVTDTALTAQAEIKRVYGDTEQSTLLLPIGDPAGEAALASELEKLDGVVAVDGLSIGAASRLPDELLPASLVEQFHSEKSSMLVLTTKYGTETDKAFLMVEQVREAVKRHVPDAVIAGGAFTYKDLKDVTDADSKRVAVISAIFIFLIVVITFRSLAIPIIAVFLIETAIWVNVGLVYFTQTPMSFISFIIIGAIQLGATVDYAILYISRYKENLTLLSPLEAARKTVSDTAKSILTSSLILISATFSVYFIATIRTGSELCLFIGRGALISTLMVMLILPGLMVLFDPFIRMTTIGWPKKRSANP
jgi:uncharacterized protein